MRNFIECSTLYQVNFGVPQSLPRRIPDGATTIPPIGYFSENNRPRQAVITDNRAFGAVVAVTDVITGHITHHSVPVGGVKIIDGNLAVQPEGNTSR